MADLALGECSRDVKLLQADINALLGRGTVPMDGTFDERTRDKLAELQLKLGVTQTGKLDGRTLKAIKDAKIPRTKVVVNGKVAWVTAAQLKVLQAKARLQAEKAIAPYVRMAGEVKLLVDAHKQARSANWFWSTVVDGATGNTFPEDAGAKAVKAAGQLQTAAATGKLTPTGLDRHTAVIRAHYAAIDKYRGETFGGGAQLARELTKIRDGAVVTLQITAALATGGASWEIQVGVSAGMAAYEATLKEIESASKDGSYDVGKGLSNVFIETVIDATIGLIMKGGGGGVGNMMDDAAKKATDKLGSGAKDLIRKYAIKAINGGGQKLIEDGIKGIAGLRDPKKKITRDQIVKAAAESFCKGAGLAVLGGAADKFVKNASKKIDINIFAGLGDLDKIKKDDALMEALKKAVDVAGSAAVKSALDSWSVKKPASKFEKDVIDRMMKDPKIRKVFAEAKKKKK